jgi:hypothetical protein
MPLRPLARWLKLLLVTEINNSRPCALLGGPTLSRGMRFVRVKFVTFMGICTKSQNVTLSSKNRFIILILIHIINKIIFKKLYTYTFIYNLEFNYYLKAYKVVSLLGIVWSDRSF